MSDDGIQRRGDRPKPGEPGYIDERDSRGRRSYSWPQFTANNEMAVRHGATVPRITDPIAAAMIEQLLERRPDLERHDFAVAAWARAESRCLLLHAFQTEHGTVDAEGKETVSATFMNQCERMANELRGRLGLDPKSESELATSQAQAAASVVDLDSIRARGRKALEKHRERERLRGDVDTFDAGEESK